MASARAHLFAAALCCPCVVFAADTFGLGDRHSGDVDLTGACASTGTVFVNEYTTLQSLSGSTLMVGSTTGFASGDLVLVWQAAGMSANTLASGDPSAFRLAGTTGAYELARVNSVSPGQLLLGAPLQNAGYVHAQVVRVPEFGVVVLPAGCTLAPGSMSSNAPHPWDGQVGGIVAFFSDDTGSALGSTLIDGAISADGAGFQAVPIQGNRASTNCGSADNLSVPSGGAFRGENVTSTNFPFDIAAGLGNIGNGGGGGNCSQSGGGGGGNGGLGGAGGVGTGFTAGGEGGAPVAWRNVDSPTDALYATQAEVANGSLLTRMTFGGGGGHGQMMQGEGAPGGPGGGIIFIRARHLSGSGVLHVDGQTFSPAPSPDTDGQGGGGGGGSIVLQLEGALGLPCANIQARGGAGESTSSAGVGGGGGGGGGRILVQASPTCVGSISGGGGGTAHASASGSAGALGSREAIPGSGIFCPDPTAPSDALCNAFDATKPHCNAALNFCAQCGVDAQCTSPTRPVCDVYSGTCVCSANADCPPQAPVCDGASRACIATCQLNGGDAFCSSRFGSNPGNTSHCEAGASSPFLGQCVACVSPNDFQCPNAQPACIADGCDLCDAGTPGSVCLAHGGLICDVSTGACVPDAGTGSDAGSMLDGGTSDDAGAADAGAADAGSIPFDAGPTADAGVGVDGGSDAGTADAGVSAADGGLDAGAGGSDAGLGTAGKGGCGCGADGATPVLALASLFGAAARRRRKRS